MYPPLELMPSGPRNTTHVSLAGDEKLIDAHKTQHKLPIHNGLVASNSTGPPLAELLEISQTDLSSMVTSEDEECMIVLVFAVKLHDVNDHRLVLAMVAGEDVMRKA